MGKQRKPIKSGKRFDIFRRDSFTCLYCGRRPPDAILQVDHVIPVANGGNEEDTNLVTSCRDCNLGKAAKSLDEAPASLISSLESQVEQQEQLKAMNAFLIRVRNKRQKMAAEMGTYWCEQIQSGCNLTFGRSRLRSMCLFLEKLQIDVIYSAMDLAIYRKSPKSPHQDEDAFKYFCGICWKEIRARNGGASK